MKAISGGALLGALIGAATVSGCSGGGPDTPTGTVSVSLMDRPVDDVTALFVTITEVWVKPRGSGPAFQLPMTSSPLTIDLLAHDDQNASVLVSEALVPAASYNWLELVIDDSTIDKSYAMTTTGGMVPVTVDVDVPSDSIRLVSGFDIGPNQGFRVLLDWDVRKGLTEAVGTGELILRPAFRILDVDEYGAIEGSIADTRIAAEPSCAGVSGPDTGTVIYVFAGGETPDDIDGIDADPITTAPATYNTETSGYDYRVALMPGDYTVAATCEGDLDADDTDDAISFFPAGGILVNPPITGPDDLVEINFD